MPPPPTTPTRHQENSAQLVEASPSPCLAYEVGEAALWPASGAWQTRTLTSTPHAGWGYDQGLPDSGALARESPSEAVDMVLATAVEAVRVQLAEHERQLDVHARLQSDLKVLDSVRKRLEEDVEGKVRTLDL